MQKLFFHKKLAIGRGTGKAFTAAFALILPLLADGPAPVRPAEPFRAVSTDTPDLEDYVLGREKRFTLLPPLDVVVTGYSSTVDQTDSTPFITASMTKVRPGVIALSRDLIRTYNPKAPFRYGDRVRIEGVGEFVVEDTMNKRYEKRADIWFSTRNEAIRWGKKTLAISLVSAGGSGFSDPGGFVRRGASAPSG